MKKSQIILLLLAAGLLCMMDGFIMKITWMEPQSERQIMEKVLTTIAMLGSGVFMLVIYFGTVIETATWCRTITLPVTAASWLFITGVTGYLLPVPAQLQGPIPAFGLLMVLLVVSVALLTYYANFCKPDDSKADDGDQLPKATKREKQMLRWGR